MPRTLALTEAQVRAIKQSLLRGTHPIALAQVYGVGAETIRRIARGETHTRVRVAGEERLRPGLNTEGLVAVPGEVRELKLPELTPEQLVAVEEQAQRIMASQRVVRQETPSASSAVDMFMAAGKKG